MERSFEVLFLLVWQCERVCSGGNLERLGLSENHDLSHQIGRHKLNATVQSYTKKETSRRDIKQTIAIRKGVAFYVLFRFSSKKQQILPHAAISHPRRLSVFHLKS